MKRTGGPLFVAAIALASFGLLGCPPPIDPVGPSAMVSQLKITGIPLTILEGDPFATDDSVGWIMVGPAGFQKGHATGGIAVFNANSRFPGARIPEIEPDGDGFTATVTVGFYRGAYDISMDMAKYLNKQGNLPSLPSPVSLEFFFDEGVDISYVDVEYRDEDPGAMPNYMINTKWTRFSENDIDSSGTMTLRWENLANAGGATVAYAKGRNVAEKLQWVKDNYQIRGIYIVEVTGDQTQTLPSVLNAASQAYTHISYDGKPVTVRIVNNNAERYTLKIDSRGSLFRVGANVTLEISGNITLEGFAGNGAAVVDTAGAATDPPVRGGNFVMNSGVIITGNTSTANGSGVSNSGTFTMNSGAKITGNKTTQNGAGVINTGTFTMNGGEISDNEITGTGSGGGVFNNGAGATFIMNDGKIAGNIAGRDGGGVQNAGTFTMNGGEISGNKGRNGGGVNTVRSFVMTGGIISGNEAKGDANAANGFGGGVAVNAQSATIVGSFEMTGGTIHGNDNGNPVINNTAKVDGSAAVGVGTSNNPTSNVPNTDSTVTKP